MIDFQAIADYLNTKTSRIKSATEWANCLFVVVKGLGARFVSKKVGIMSNPYMMEAQRLIDEAKKSSGSGEDRCYKFIHSDKAAKWAVEIISKFNCGMDESLLKLLWQNIESVKPDFRNYTRQVQDGLEEAAFWAAENAKWDSQPEPKEDNEYQQWLKDEADKELGYQF